MITELVCRKAISNVALKSVCENAETRESAQGGDFDVQNKCSSNTRKMNKLSNRNPSVSVPLSPIFYLFLAPTGKLYLKVQDLLAHDEAHDASPPPMVGKRRPGPKHPKYSIPAEHWPMVIHRIVEQKEPLRTVAAAYGVSHETIRRLIRAVTKEYV